MHKIFISYSRRDKKIVFKLKGEIEHIIGKGSSWIDITGIESDSQFTDVIIDAIDQADIFLFMYSTHSERSEWTRKEVEYAQREKKRIVFVKIDNYPLSKFYLFHFGGQDIIDITQKEQKNKLFKDLKDWTIVDSSLSSPPKTQNSESRKKREYNYLLQKINGEIPHRIKNTATIYWNKLKKAIKGGDIALSLEHLIQTLIIAGIFIFFFPPISAIILIFSMIIHRKAIIESCKEILNWLSTQKNWGTIYCMFNLCVSIFLIALSWICRYDKILSYTCIFWTVITLVPLIAIWRKWSIKPNFQKWQISTGIISAVLCFCSYILSSCDKFMLEERKTEKAKPQPIIRTRKYNIATTGAINSSEFYFFGNLIFSKTYKYPKIECTASTTKNCYRLDLEIAGTKVNGSFKNKNNINLGYVNGTINIAPPAVIIRGHLIYDNDKTPSKTFNLSFPMEDNVRKEFEKTSKQK